MITLAFFWPTMAPEFMWREVVMEANAISSKTPGPMGLKFLGSSKGSNVSSVYDGLRPVNLFSQ